jgi:hypothetical protein
MDAGARRDHWQRAQAMRFARALWLHESLPLEESIYLAHACARASCWPPTPLMVRKRWQSCSCLSKRILRPLSRCGKHRWQNIAQPADGFDERRLMRVISIFRAGA